MLELQWQCRPSGEGELEAKPRSMESQKKKKEEKRSEKNVAAAVAMVSKMRWV